MYYEVSYYLDKERTQPEFIGFKTREKALDFYKIYQADYYGWFITKNKNSGKVIEVIVLE